MCVWWRGWRRRTPQQREDPEDLLISGSEGRDVCWQVVREGVSTVR